MIPRIEKQFNFFSRVIINTTIIMFRNVLEGSEYTIFAYGQTGTGKTYTMHGDISDPVGYGFIPRSVDTIFSALKNEKYVEYKVSCSHMEIHNEKLGDLLAEKNSKTKLDIMKTKTETICR